MSEKWTHGTNYGYSKKGCRCEYCTAYNSYARAMTVQRTQENPLAEDDPRHGKPGTYRNRGCRCERCLEAHRKACAKPPNKPTPHGTENGYSNYRCRCELCRQAHREYSREYYRSRLIPRQERKRVLQLGNTY